MAIMRKEKSGGKKATAAEMLAAGSGGGNRIAGAISKSIAQRREREAHVDLVKGTGLPPHKIAPSAVHIVAGIGLRFVSTAKPLGPMPHIEYCVWGGDHADVYLTFPELRDPLSQRQTVDPYAFVPKPNAHLQFIPAGLLGEATRGEAAAARVVPGSELTSTMTEKEHGRVLDFLVKAGVDIDAGDADGVTALMLAAKYGLLFLLRKLLTRGADPALADRAGNTALHYAFAFNQWTAAEVITEFTRADSDGEGAGHGHHAGGGAGAPAVAVAVSVLDGVENDEGRKPREVAGSGILILPDCSDGKLVVARQPKKSGSLNVTQAL